MISSPRFGIPFPFTLLIMKPAFRLLLLLSLVSVSGWLSASSEVRGDVRTFTSPTGVEESCVALAPMPGGSYSPSDRNQEKKFCSIDFYDSNVALCPKFFSTSPGTLVYQISSGPYAGNPKGFEHDVCPRGKIMHKEADGPPISYKVTMNARGTSGTFSTAALLYYHFSRYFGTRTLVPMSVYRSMDRKVHLERVTEPGLRYSARHQSLKMNHAAWQRLAGAERKPESYHPTDELFTRDRKRIYGIFLHPSGKRYGAEFNGTRRSGWGDGQNRDFQKTAPYLALRSGLPLEQAIEAGLKQARRDPTLRKSMGHHVSRAQMVSWMQDLTEIVLLDYIFSQQDRIGNIDYLEYWYWKENGQLKSRPARGKHPPADLKSFEPLKLRRSVLNDNDAGGRLAYVNYAKRTGMLEDLHHYNPQLYRRLMRLADDYARKGELYHHLETTFGLSPKQVAMIVKNTREAARILRRGCEKGKLRFDLLPDDFMLRGKVTESGISCSG